MTSHRIHAGFLIAIAALIPLGEGITLLALGGLLLSLLARRHTLAPEAVTQGAARGVHLGLVVWLAAGVAALLLGGEGWQRPGELGRWLPLVLIPAAALSAGRVPEGTLKRAGAAFIALLGIAALFALYQYVFNARPGESLSRVQTTYASQSRVPGRYEQTVAGGFYFHRLKMAHVLVVGLSVLGARQLFARLVLRRRALELGVIGLFGAALLLTYARGALLAVAAGGLACLPFAHRRVRWAALCAGLLALGAVAAVPSLRARAVSIGSEQTSETRALIWSQAARVIADHPLGVGIGNYPTVVGRYYDDTNPAFTIRTYPHNVWLAAWAETGPVGMAGFIGAWLAFAAACIAVLRRPEHPRRATAGAGLFGVVAMLTLGLTHDVLFHNAVALAFAGLVGWVLADLREVAPRG